MAEQRTRAASTSADDEKDEKTPTPREAVREAVKEAREDAPDEEIAFPRERLIAEAEAFGLGPSYVVAGALHAAGAKKHFTTIEAEAAVKAFLQTVAPTEVR